MKKGYLMKTLIFFMGIMIMSFGIAMIIEANLGVSAWDVLHIGLYKTLGLTIGTWSQIAGFVVIAATYFIDKTILAVGTLLNMLFVGWFIDLSLFILPTMDHWLGQTFFLLTGILIMGMGSGMYISSKLGPGPRDSLVIVMSKKFNWSIGRIKTAMEVIVLIIGWFLGGPVFIGTIISSIMIGPVMQYFIKRWDAYFSFPSFSSN